MSTLCQSRRLSAKSLLRLPGRFAVAHRGALSRPDRDSGQHAATRRITTLPARSEVPLRPIRLANGSRRQEAEDAELRSYVNRDPHGSK